MSICQVKEPQKDARHATECIYCSTGRIAIFYALHAIRKRDRNYNLEPKFIEMIEFGAETV